MDERAKDESVGWDAEDRDLDMADHLQDYGVKINVAGFNQHRGAREPQPLPPDPRAARHWRQQRHPPCYQARYKACRKYGHKEAWCEYLSMYLWCCRYMTDRLEEEVMSVSTHWTERNQQHPT